jgi:hypothetical protein
MAKTGKTPNPVSEVCPMCGKPTPRSHGLGHRCASLTAAGLTPELLAEIRKELTVDSVPSGYMKVADLHRLIDTKKAEVKGLSVNRMVVAMGRDRVSAKPLHPICKPVYDSAGVRWVSKWLATPAGLKALASYDFSKAPKVATVEAPAS